MTKPDKHKTRALQVSRTWGRRCDYLKFLTTQSDDTIETWVSNTTGGLFIFLYILEKKTIYLLCYIVFNSTIFIRRLIMKYGARQNLDLRKLLRISTIKLTG